MRWCKRFVNTSLLPKRKKISAHRSFPVHTVAASKALANPAVVPVRHAIDRLVNAFTPAKPFQTWTILLRSITQHERGAHLPHQSPSHHGSLSQKRWPKPVPKAEALMCSSIYLANNLAAPFRPHRLARCYGRWTIGTVRHRQRNPAQIA